MLHPPGYWWCIWCTTSFYVTSLRVLMVYIVYYIVLCYILQGTGGVYGVLHRSMLHPPGYCWCIWRTTSFHVISPRELFIYLNTKLQGCKWRILCILSAHTYHYFLAQQFSSAPAGAASHGESDVAYIVELDRADSEKMHNRHYNTHCIVPVRKSHFLKMHIPLCYPCWRKMTSFILSSILERGVFVVWLIQHCLKVKKNIILMHWQIIYSEPL